MGKEKNSSRKKLPHFQSHIYTTIYLMAWHTGCKDTLPMQKLKQFSYCQNVGVRLRIYAD